MDTFSQGKVFELYLVVKLFFDKLLLNAFTLGAGGWATVTLYKSAL
jgi:hypothetical protein